MKKILKWVAIVLGALVGLIAVLLFVIVLVSSSKMNQDFSEVQVAAITIPTDQASIDHGKHVFETYGVCAECHKDDASGDNLGDDPVFGRLIASNLTSGEGGVGGTFQDIDYVRAIRHGLGTDSKSLVIMPAQYFTKFSDRDLGALIAYIKSVPPVDNVLPKTKLGPLGRIIALMEPHEFLPATGIDHTAGREEPPPGVTEVYGKYLATICSACHQKDFAGGPIAGVEPGFPEAPNITNLTGAGWAFENFTSFMRTGVNYTGRQVDNEHMPWERFRNLTDDEIEALWLFVSNLTPVTSE